MPKRLSRRQQQERTRARLIEAGAKVFARKGYRASSLDEIAERAGMTKGAVYSNFKSKEELFLAVIEAKSVLAETLHTDPALELAEQLRAYALRAARSADARALLELVPLELEFMLLATRDTSVRHVAAQADQAIRSSLAEWFAARARQLGVEPSLPAASLATSFLAMIRGLVQQRLLDPAAAPDELFGQAVVLFLGNAGLTPEAP